MKRPRVAERLIPRAADLGAVGSGDWKGLERRSRKFRASGVADEAFELAARYRTGFRSP